MNNVEIVLKEQGGVKKVKVNGTDISIQGIKYEEYVNERGVVTLTIPCVLKVIKNDKSR